MTKAEKYELINKFEQIRKVNENMSLDDLFYEIEKTLKIKHFSEEWLILPKYIEKLKLLEAWSLQRKIK